MPGNIAKFFAIAALWLTYSLPAATAQEQRIGTWSIIKEQSATTDDDPVLYYMFTSGRERFSNSTLGFGIRCRKSQKISLRYYIHDTVVLAAKYNWTAPPIPLTTAVLTVFTRGYYGGIIKVGEFGATESGYEHNGWRSDTVPFNEDDDDAAEFLKLLLSAQAIGLHASGAPPLPTLMFSAQNADRAFAAMKKKCLSAAGE